MSATSVTRYRFPRAVAVATGDGEVMIRFKGSNDTCGWGIVGRLCGGSVDMKEILRADEEEEGGATLLELAMMRRVTVVWYGGREASARGL